MEQVTENVSSSQTFVSGKEQRKKRETRGSDTPLMGPGALTLLTLAAGPMISGPVTGSILVHLGFRKAGWFSAASMALAGFAINVGLILWPVKWYWSSLTLAAVHVLTAAILFYFMRKLHLENPDSYQSAFSVSRKQDRQYMVVGMISGIVLSIILGGSATIFFLLASDRLFANLMPVAFSDWQSLSYYAVALLCLAISGCIVGGYMGRNALKVTPMQMIALTAALIWISLTWLFALEFIIAIPGFQAGQAAGAKRATAWFPFFTGNFLIGTWWSPFLFNYFIKPLHLRAKLFRLVQIPVIHISAAITVVVLFGYSNNIFHAAGRYFERNAQVQAALWCYEQGLKKNPTAAPSSYLQYRVALLAHKLGEREKAQQGFRKVVSKYTFDGELVKKANRFLDNMERNGVDKKRVVLPGIEAPIAYKGSYCVPNSLALVMRFWGSELNARDIGQKITGLSRGTMIVDQAWYAEHEGFRHEFLPNASIEDIKTAIDAGFPVMVYVPRHVFAIVGYDDILDTFVTYDVATGDVWVDYLRKDFIKSWKKQGTPLVLAYPPDMENNIPEGIRNRLVSMSDEYLQYHLYYNATPESYAGSTHLMQAAGKGDDFFIPLTVLYKDFPGLRPLLNEKYNIDAVADSIVNFFGSDFDEGIHQAGQYHDEYESENDVLLQYSLTYLIGQKKLQQAQNLVTTIEEQGPISDETHSTLGMINLALGDLENGVYHLNEGGESELKFYQAMAEMQNGNIQAAINDLVKTVDGCT